MGTIQLWTTTTKMLVFQKGGKLEYSEKKNQQPTSENQQAQPTYGTRPESR